MGTIVKEFLPSKLQIEPSRIYHVTVMPCFDKKLEASRGDFQNIVAEAPEVDCVVTSLEIEEMLVKEDLTLVNCTSSPLDSILGEKNFTEESKIVQAAGASGSGGWAEGVARHLSSHIHGHHLEEQIEFKPLRNPDFREVILGEGKQQVNLLMNMYKVLTHLAFNIGESGSSLWVQKHSKPGSEDEKETLRLRFCRSDGLSWWLPQWRCTVPTRGRQRDLEGDSGEVGGGQQRPVEYEEARV